MGGEGLTIGTGIHLGAKTVALLLTLRDGVVLANAGHFPAEIDAAGHCPQLSRP
jgi:hypothetical protein